MLAQKAGFDFVDVKHCHGYLGHEFLSAVNREGRYGGSFENRTRYLRNIVAGIRQAAPGLEIGIRLSAFDMLPFKKGDTGTGIPEQAEQYPFAFGGNAIGLGIDLTETKALLVAGRITRHTTGMYHRRQSLLQSAPDATGPVPPF